MPREQGPCYRCLYPEPPPPGLVPSCAEGGVLGILPGLVGVIQATEVIKLILGKGEPLIGRLLLVDALAMRFRELKLRKNPECPVCGENPTVTQLIDYDQFCGIAPETATGENLEERNSADHGAGTQSSASTRAKTFSFSTCASLTSTRSPTSAARSFRKTTCRSGWPKSTATARSWCSAAPAAAASASRSSSRRQGYPNVKNLAGGILAWADQIDPKVQKY